MPESGFNALAMKESSSLSLFDSRDTVDYADSLFLLRASWQN
jgi:hypothetical protein